MIEKGGRDPAPVRCGRVCGAAPGGRAMQERLPAGLTRRRLLLSGEGGVATLLLSELSALATPGEPSRSSRNIPQRRWR
jgi:hypothetical protein